MTPWACQDIVEVNLWAIVNALRSDHGVENVISGALFCGVDKVAVLSRDKAAKPINLCGGIKLVPDKPFVAANNIAGFRRTRFSVARYANVGGSSAGIHHSTSISARGQRDGSFRYPRDTSAICLEGDEIAGMLGSVPQ